ncbi:hypothetical protein Y032_0839g2616 [Ancylostoma ceylanicum]|uniref:Secreted protein n=1 Tax=Ancylostoma ceylanicum TaxID=53326 RepID=A0A016WAW5_9BILA|nr:hypothetical protein Y032_0839g2616 [Ancylostoma ceylanicum]
MLLLGRLLFAPLLFVVNISVSLRSSRVFCSFLYIFPKITVPKVTVPLQHGTRKQPYQPWNVITSTNRWAFDAVSSRRRDGHVNDAACVRIARQSLVTMIDVCSSSTCLATQILL